MSERVTEVRVKRFVRAFGEDQNCAARSRSFSLSLLLLSECFSFSTSIVRAAASSSGSRFRAYKVSRGNRGSYYYPYTSSLFPCECMVHIQPPVLPPPRCRLRSWKKRLLQRPHFLHGKRGPPARVVISIPSRFISVFPALRPPFLSRSSPPPLSPFFLHFLSIRSHSSPFLASVFVCPPLCVGLVIQTDTPLLSPFASSSR